MVVQHNLMAMNTNRMFGITNKNQANKTEKLSSGYRINRAADDAAGLAISEKMRRQIRGLTQASNNCQDGISLVQTADGAMAEVHDMLDRCTELSVKAANGTLSATDREYIQSEIDQIKEEIDKIKERTTFNEIKILKGKDVEAEVTTGGAATLGGLPSWITSPSLDASKRMLAEVYTKPADFEITITPDGGTPKSTTVTLNVDHAASILDFSQYDGSASKYRELVKDDTGFYTTCCTCTNHYSIKFVDDTEDSMSKSGSHYVYSIGIKGLTTPEQIVDKITNYVSNPNSHYTNLEKSADGKSLIVYENRSRTLSGVNKTLDHLGVTDPEAAGVSLIDVYKTSGKTISYNGVDYNIKATTTSDNRYVTSQATPSKGSGKGIFGPGIAYAADQIPKSEPVDIFIQAGAEANQHIDIKLPSISCGTLKITDTSVLTQNAAGKAITSFKEAKEYVSSERSRMGAYQNRLEHTIKNLDNVIENTVAAESQIRDTDMAKLMVEYSNNNIILQAAQAMMAQANQSKQGVLTLLG